MGTCVSGIGSWKLTVFEAMSVTCFSSARRPTSCGCAYIGLLMLCDSFNCTVLKRCTYHLCFKLNNSAEHMSSALAVFTDFLRNHQTNNLYDMLYSLYRVSFTQSVCHVAPRNVRDVTW